MATVKLTLFNAERDILVDVDVSAADAQRASTDTLFATQLLNKIMEEIFSKKAWCDPVAVASSTGLSKKQLESNDSMGGSDSGCSIKSNKTPIATLLGKRLKQKEEHEQQKSKRHKERMEMDEKFLNVLEKLANK
ncbi:hypothetical protein KQX54_017238 [Cotesia glomerata]|uniref:Uncharacterized protein n=1 Tax=Cotesia glomerata TaxID=32391 RepID=A0AAV7J4X9_COTGL|nr:hypothetical protein KQX54_017238 [Cotesia glomerata]